MLVERFEVKIVRSEYSPSYNIAPSTPIAVITRENPNVLSTMRWGMVTGDDRYGNLINARSEKMTINKLYKEAFETKRCLIPTTGFYEWKKPKNDLDRKTPYFIRLKNEEAFAFAGIYSVKTMMDRFLTSEVSESISGRSCAILTTEPNELMLPIHNRMPVILKKEYEHEWLDQDADLNDLVRMFEPFPAKEMQTYPVSTFVNSPDNNSPKCIEELDEVALYRQQMGQDADQASLDDFF